MGSMEILDTPAVHPFSLIPTPALCPEAIPTIHNINNQNNSDVDLLASHQGFFGTNKVCLEIKTLFIINI